MRLFLILLAVTAAALAACSQSHSEPVEPRGSSSPYENYPSRGITHWTDFSHWDDATTADAARADLVIFPVERCFSPLGTDIIARMRELNPDIRILGYLTVLQVKELYYDTTYLERYLPWELEFYRLVEDCWAWTTTGDTFSIWPGTIFLDPIDERGRPDDELITGIVDMLEEYTDAWPGAIDGLMHDYIMYQPYVSPWNDNVDGDVDLDGNGTPTGEDENERDVFLRWEKDYIAAIRSRMGPRFIQIANGRVPQEDEELAGNLNGIFYELFPNMCWGITDRAGFEILLENQAEGWLTEAHGRTWSMVTNNTIEYNNMFCMLSSLLADCVYTDLAGAFNFTGWSIEINAGQALSGLTVEGRADSILTYRRSFSGGEALISFNPNGGRREWTFIENN